MHPTVKPPHKIAHHAVGIFVAKLPQNHFAAVGFAVVVGIRKMIHVRNAVRNRTVSYGHDADRDIEAILKIGKFIGFAIAVGIFQNGDFIPPSPTWSKAAIFREPPLSPDVSTTWRSGLAR